ncbi:MAG: serine/threonine-protein kinase, partial [Roseiarcus sp.]
MPAHSAMRRAAAVQVRSGLDKSFQVWSASVVEDRTVFQPAPSGSVRPGARLNGIYEIESLIAQGGMGEVYKGFNIQTHDPVAIKMIRPELSRNPDALALFRREASTLHNLQHEAIVRYFVFSVDPDLQRAYLAMEFVDGPSLTKRLASGPLPLAEVKILQKRIGGALDAAHRLGVVHRDISSDNVILPDGDVRRAKIIDFGIARSHRPGEGTIIGDGFAGKYAYVSPEQVGLSGGEVTFKSDIYSFGLVLAEALRGRPIDMSGSQADVIEKRRVVPDLSDIDASIRPLIQAMLQPSPENRPASMAAVAEWGETRGAGAAKAPVRGGRQARPPGRSSGGR